MRQIYKYSISGAMCSIALPKDSKIVAFGMQSGDPYIWAEVNPDKSNVDRHFTIFGTGQAIPTAWEHLFTMQDGPFVWHLYERIGA